MHFALSPADSDASARRPGTQRQHGKAGAEVTAATKAGEIIAMLEGGPERAVRQEPPHREPDPQDTQTPIRLTPPASLDLTSDDTQVLCDLVARTVEADLDRGLI